MKSPKNEVEIPVVASVLRAFNFWLVLNVPLSCPNIFLLKGNLLLIANLIFFRGINWYPKYFFSSSLFN
jgi:hypothetical protein